MLADKIGYNHAKACGFKGFAFSFNIVVRNNGGDNGGIGAWASDSVFFKRLDKRSFGKAARRRGKVLVWLKLFYFKHIALGGVLWNRGLFFVAVGIKNGEAVESYGKARSFKAVISRGYINRNRIIKRGSHLACDEPVPNKLIELILVGRKAVLKLCGSKPRHGGTNCLVSVLHVSFGFIHLCGGRQILFSVSLLNIFRRCGFGLCGNTKRVGSHIGDKTHGAHSGNIHAFIKLLRYAHGAAGLKTKLDGSFLLKRGGDERRSGLLFSDALFNSGNNEGYVLQLRQNGICFLLVVNIKFFVIFSLQFCGKCGSFAFFAKLCVNAPVFFRNKALNFAFAVYDKAYGDGLNAPC